MSVARIFVEIFVQNIVFSLPLSLSNSVCCMAKNAVTGDDAAQWRVWTVRIRLQYEQKKII